MAVTVRIGQRFEIGAVMGAGGMGVVHRARDLATGKPVALKLLRQGVDGERFTREAEVLSRLHDPHVVEYVAHGTEPDGTQYLAMEWIDGCTVLDRLTHDGFDVGESIALARAVARGLAAAHGMGVVHRDVKPSNLLLRDRDPARACVADFGLGRARDLASPLTRSGVVLGTPGYMAPEQALAQRTLDARADLFALGAILYECLTGRPAFSGGDRVAVQCKVIAFSPTPVLELAPEVPAALSDLCERLLAKYPAERPPDAGAVLEILEHIEPQPGPRRVRPLESQATEVGHSRRPSHARFVIMASAPLDADGEVAEADPAAIARAEAACASEGRSLSALAEGGWMVVIADVAQDAGARQASRLARVLASALPTAIVVVTGASESERAALDTAIDHGSALLDRAVRESVFGAGPVPRGAVRIDPFTAGVLTSDEGVSRTPDVAWLQERP